MIQCYFGNGKGKTTASVGAAVRYAGSGNKVLYVSFLKNNRSSEFAVFSKLEKIDVLYSPVEYRLFDNQKEDLSLVFSDAYTKLLAEAEKRCDSYDMIVLDEILDTVSFGYVSENVLVEFLKVYGEQKEIVLTGHSLPESIEQLSDYISEVRAVKHPFYGGALPRKGIEY